jgi:hypothetical protein
MAPRACPNCGKKFVLRPEKRYCDLACCEAFWMEEASKANHFLMEKGLWREFNEWIREGNA